MRVALGGKGCFANPPRTFFTGKGFRFTLSRADVKRPGRKPFLRGPSTAESVLCRHDDDDSDRPVTGKRIVTVKMKFVSVATFKELKPAVVSECEKAGGGANASTKERACWVRHFCNGEPMPGLVPMDRSRCTSRR